MNVLVTGASGFVGGALVNQLSKRSEYFPIAVCRRELNALPAGINQVFIEDFTKNTRWEKYLAEIDVIVHCAARVHVMRDDSSDPLSEFRGVNVDATINLARQAAKAGVRRFVYLSSIKVNGESTEPGCRFSPSDINVPTDPYGRSKYEAEQELFGLAKEVGMEVVVIRPPLVYGPGVKGNFYSMLKWVNSGVPLPFGSINNKRSLVALDNLVNFIICCIEHPKSINGIFLVSDCEDVSTTELLDKVYAVFGKTPRLIAIPEGLLYFAAKLIGKKHVVSRLLGSLQIDSSKTRELLGWKPVVTMDEELKKTVGAYLEGNSSK